MSEHAQAADNARLPNGLTPEQDRAFDALAEAWAKYLTAQCDRRKQADRIA